MGPLSKLQREALKLACGFISRANCFYVTIYSTCWALRYFPKKAYCMHRRSSIIRERISIDEEVSKKCYCVNAVGKERSEK
jgi:hypothetical protein